MNKKNYWLPAALMVLGVIGIIVGHQREGEIRVIDEAWYLGFGYGLFVIGVILLIIGNPKK